MSSEPTAKIDIKLGDLSDPIVIALLEEHLREMHEVSCPESCHVLDLSGLRASDVKFWTAHQSGRLAGCAGLKKLDADHAEIKSMRTTDDFRGKGIGKLLLEFLIDQAQATGYHRLSLETGSMAFFEPARRLYEKFGFEYCDPFAGYAEDPNSVFMTLELSMRDG